MRKPFDKQLRLTERIVRQLRDRSVLVAATIALSNFGKDGDHIQISPPFIISEREIELLIAALDDALLVVSRELHA